MLSFRMASRAGFFAELREVGNEDEREFSLEDLPYSARLIEEKENVSISIFKNSDLVTEFSLSCETGNSIAHFCELRFPEILLVGSEGFQKLRVEESLQERVINKGELVRFPSNFSLQGLLVWGDNVVALTYECHLHIWPLENGRSISIGIPNSATALFADLECLVLADDKGLVWVYSYQEETGKCLNQNFADPNILFRSVEVKHTEEEGWIHLCDEDGNESILRLDEIIDEHSILNLKAIEHSTGETSQNIETKKAENDQELFLDVLLDPTGREIFRQFLRKNYCDENLNFWMDIVDYKLQPDQMTLSFRKVARTIYHKYLAEGAEYELNINGEHKRQIEECLSKPTISMFDSLQAYIFHLMIHDSWPRFKFTQEYKQFMESKTANKSVEKINEKEEEEQKKKKAEEAYKRCKEAAAREYRRQQKEKLEQLLSRHDSSVSFKTALRDMDMQDPSKLSINTAFRKIQLLPQSSSPQQGIERMNMRHSTELMEGLTMYRKYRTQNEPPKIKQKSKTRLKRTGSFNTKLNQIVYKDAPANSRFHLKLLKDGMLLDCRIILGKVSISALKEQFQTERNIEALVSKKGVVRFKQLKKDKHISRYLTDGTIIRIISKQDYANLSKKEKKKRMKEDALGCIRFLGDQFESLEQRIVYQYQYYSH